MNLSLLAGAITLLLTATMGAGSDPAALLAEDCPGVDPLTVVPGNGEPGRYYLYRATLNTAFAYVPGGCGRFYTDNAACGCTFWDTFVYGDAHFIDEWSFNKVENRPDVHLFVRPLIDPYFSAYDYEYDFNGGIFYSARVNSDDYKTYFITQACNATLTDPADQLYRVYTKSPTPTQATQYAIEAYLQTVGQPDMPYIDQNNCTYPASTYTTPETQIFSE